MQCFLVDDGCAAIVVAYRSATTLRACLVALAQDRAVHEVVVVDNSSDDETERVVREVEAEFRCGISYVDPGENVGFAAACNLGIASSRAPAIALVNPDVRLTKSLGPLLAWLSTAPRCVIAGGLAGNSGELCNARSEANTLREMRRAMVGSPRAVPLPRDGRIHRVDQVDGALLLFERSTVTQLGGLSETFPLYFEDVELCWRIRRAGGDVVIHAQEYGLHEGGVSSGQNPGAYQALRISRQRWLRLRQGFPGSVMGLCMTAVELVTRTAGRRPEGLGARWHAVVAGVRELRHPGSQRPLT